MLANLERARDRMARSGLDALVCVLPKNVYYFSDYESDWLFDFPWAACAIVPRETSIPATLIVHDVELTNLAERPSWMPELRIYQARVGAEALPHYDVAENVRHTPDDLRTLELIAATSATASDGLVTAVANVLDEHRLSAATLGYDDLRFSQAVQAMRPASRAQDALSLTTDIRMVKTEAELALLTIAAQNNVAALQNTLASVRVGAMWRDIKQRYFVSAVERDCLPFALYVGAGTRSTGIRPNEDYAIESGDQVCFDAMLTYKRYFGDCQRTAAVGNASAKLEKYWNAVRTAASECYEIMAPGISTAMLHDHAVAVVRAHGIPGFRHAFVHGLGLDHLEIPVSSKQFGTFDLEPGMVVNMDLEVCELGFGGVYFEQTMLITSRGAQPLVPGPIELVRLN